MIEGGYYIKARKIQDSKISIQPPYVREIWDWLLKEANHSDAIYGGFTVKRGQLFRTYSEIREGLHWMVGWRKMTYNENQTKRAMKFLRDALMITTKKELGGVLITINKYDTYQNPKNYERTTKDTEEITIEEPLKNQTLPDNNKKKENNNIVKRENDFKEEVMSFGTKYKLPMLKDFFTYWSEPNKSKTKMRFELQQTWSTAGRLSTWNKRSQK